MKMITKKEVKEFKRNVYMRREIATISGIGIDSPLKEEIKEILDRLDFNEWEVDLYKVPITWAELYDVRDYISNLQKENKRLNNIINKDFDKFNDELNTFKFLENDFEEHSIHYYQVECLVEYLKQLKRRI